MSQVHNVTHIQVHSLPLGAFVLASRYFFISLGVLCGNGTAGKNLARFTSRRVGEHIVDNQ
jgi:hypothetical protein